MLYEIVHSFPQDMIIKEDGPLISLYQPTHRSFPDSKQDPIVFKNLLRDIENSLKKIADMDLIGSIMKPFYELESDEDFWNNTTMGLAIFASQNKCIVYKLNNTVKEYAAVANSFHIKPLIKAFQSIENYLLLGLSRENFALYKGNRLGFEEIVIDKDVPRTLEQVLGDQLSESDLSQRSYDGAGGPTMFYGNGGSKPEINKDTEKYFRYVDNYVYENYSKPLKLPLILVSIKEYHSEFKRISNNPYLLEAGIEKSIESLDLEEIQKKTQIIIDEINMGKIKKLTESYEQAAGESLGTSDLALAVKAAYEGRVETILIEGDKIVPGKIDFQTGEIEFGDIASPDYGDVLDDLAELVFSNGGAVVIVEKDKMPVTTGIAVIFRYS